MTMHNPDGQSSDEHEGSIPPLNVRAMTIRDGAAINAGINPHFDVTRLMHKDACNIIAYVAEAGDSIIGYMVYTLKNGTAVINECKTHPDFSHAAYAMIVGLQTGEVMHTVQKNMQSLLKIDPETLQPTSESGKLIAELLLLRKQILEVSNVDNSAPRQKKHIVINVQRDDGLMSILEELGFRIESIGTDVIKMEYRSK